MNSSSSHLASLPQGASLAAHGAAAHLSAIHLASEHAFPANDQPSASAQHWSLSLSAGQPLMTAGSQGPLWRIAKGWVALSQPGNGSGNPLVQLAGPGDVVGIAALSGAPYRETAMALTPVLASPQLWPHESDRLMLMHAVMAQQQRQARDMTLLRTGPVQCRLRHLLTLLGDGRSQCRRKGLPPLRDLAQIVDAAPATVCRELGRLLPEAEAAMASVAA